MDAGMWDHFKYFPDARSTLSRHVEYGLYVTGVETALDIEGQGALAGLRRHL